MRLLRMTTVLGLGALAMPLSALPPDGGDFLRDHAASDLVSAALDKRLVAEAATNIERLRAEGALPESTQAIAGLVWPLGPVPGAGNDWHGISNFVDLDPAYPNLLRDYSCGTRTYDNSSGYNHRGIDFFIWPFSWTLMDEGAVDVRAAAPGTLVAKGDGNDDRSCSFDAPDTPNYAIILHADGSIARYLHLKRGSVTSLPIGTPIAAGQVLGKVGSSGISTGPHLHFELRASNQAGAAVIEPFQGLCNASNSTWASQRPYRDSRINRLTTHHQPPLFPTCPSTVDQPNLRDIFQPGEQIFLMAAYRDQGRGQATDLRLLRPNGSVHSSWRFDMAEVNGTPPYYNGSYWYWSQQLPFNAPAGHWIFEASFQGQTSRHYFRVGSEAAAIRDPRGLMGAWFEPATSGQGLELIWINSDILAVYFYGHRNDGSNVFLLGTRQGMFDYGQEIELPMHATTGGRFDNFDATQIQRPLWGTLRLTFENCDRALAVLQGADGNKTMVLERLGRTAGLSCD